MRLNRRSALYAGAALGWFGLAALTGCRTPKQPYVDTEKFEGKVIKVACVGDSITYGSGVEDREKNCYPAKLGVFLGDGFEVRNFGRSGATLQKAGDLPYWTTEELVGVAEFKPDVIILKLGTNDTKPQNWKDGATFARDFRSLVDHFRSAKRRPQIWVCTPVPVYHDNFGINGTILEEALIPALMVECGKLKLPVIDLGDTLTGHPEMFPDGIHPNAAGAEVMARTVVDAISLRGAAVGSRRDIFYPTQGGRNSE